MMLGTGQLMIQTNGWWVKCEFASVFWSWVSWPKTVVSFTEFPLKKFANSFNTDLLLTIIQNCAALVSCPCKFPFVNELGMKYFSHLSYCSQPIYMKISPLYPYQYYQISPIIMVIVRRLTAVIKKHCIDGIGIAIKFMLYVY